MIWEKTKNKQSPELMIKLLKIFKIWDMFFAKETLNQISETLKLDEEEKKYLTPVDQEKIKKFKASFMPTFDMLPEHLYSQNKVIVGNQISRAQLDKMYMDYRG